MSFVAILGATLTEARYWRRQFQARVPELERAMEATAQAAPSSYWGVKVTRLYIAPGAERLGGFWPVYDALCRELVRAQASDDVVWLDEDRGAA